MYLPHAHHLIWFSATFLFLWSLSLIVRGMPGTRILRFLHTKSTGQERTQVSLRAIGVGAVVCVLSIWLFSVGESVRIWALGQSEFDERSGFGVYHAAAAGIFAFAVTLACMGLFRDSARGRKRCPKCWYDMASVAASGRLVCPECGTDAKDVKRLQRTRRHRAPIIAAGLLTLVAALLPRFQHISTGGVKAVLPTTVLIAGVWVWPDEWIESTAPDDKSSLWDRLDEEDAWGWQRRWAADRASSKLRNVRTLKECERAVTVLQASHDDETNFFFPPDTVANAARRLASTDAEVRSAALEICQGMLAEWYFAAFSPASVEQIAAAGDEIASAMDSPDSDIVYTAAKILAGAETRRAQVVAGLLKGYAQLSDRALTSRTWLLLNEPVIEPAVIEAIDARLASPDPLIRRMTLDGVMFFHTDMSSIETLIKRLETMGESDPDSGIAASAALRCVRMRERQPDAEKFLREKARSSGHFRVIALERLAYVDAGVPLDAEIHLLIAEALRGTDPDALLSVLDPIGYRAHMGDKTMKEYLHVVAALMTHADSRVREAAEASKNSIERIDQNEKNESNEEE